MERVKRTKLAELLRKDYVQTVIMILIVIVIYLVFWYGLIFAFRTEHPLLAVASESMKPVLYEGDLILVHGVQNVCEIHAASKDTNPPGDIIIFRDPEGDLTVHRAVEKINEDGRCYFRTQGDANSASLPWERKLGEEDIVGKFTGAKVPWLGHIALFFEPLSVKVTLIFLWIILLIIIALVSLSRKQIKEEPPSS